MAVINSSSLNMRESVEWAVQKQLEHYSADVIKAMQDVVPEVAKEAASRLKKGSPKKTGQYAKGWTYKVDKGRVSVGATVYGKNGTYQLAHLLENGHAKRGGGRTAGISHIQPVEEWAVNEVVDRVIERLSEF